MAINIHDGHYEDNYIKHECGCCKKCFIVGEQLSQGLNLVCPYCGSPDIEMIAGSTDEVIEDMDMGCLGIYFDLYDDGRLMLYTECEFNQVMKKALESGGGKGVPLGAISGIMKDYCVQRDKSNM